MKRVSTVIKKYWHVKRKLASRAFSGAGLTTLPMHRHEWWRHAVNVQWAVLFRYSYEPPMLDLNFVRNNLPLVEQKLRDRGLDPAEILKDFHEVDQQRRQAITDAETIKARRNRASEEIAKLKKSGQDARTLVAETKELQV